MIASAIRTVLQGASWRKAFDENGYSDCQLHLSQYISRFLEDAVILSVPHTKPSLPEIEAVLPKHARVPYNGLFAYQSASLPPLTAPASPLALEDTPAPPPPPPRLVIGMDVYAAVTS